MTSYTLIVLGMDLSRDMEYADLSETVRHYAAERLYTMITALQPHVDGLFDSDRTALSYMEPARISAQTQVAKLYVSAVEKLGALYRVTQLPEVQEDPEPMIPAAQVPLMIEAAVQTAVDLAVIEVREELEARKVERVRIEAQAARETLSSALARIRARSS